MSKENKEWEDEYVELYGYLDNYVKGIIGRQGKWIAKLLDRDRQQVIEIAEGMKKKGSWDYGSNRERQAYNQALSDIIEKVKRS